MKRQESEMIKKAKGRLSSATGVTMVELLVVVAIITILSGVAFIAVWNYQRSMGQLERDNIAKEIFIAAQNHLTVAKGEGYRGVTDYGTMEDDDGNVYYYIVTNGTVVRSGAVSGGEGMFAQMLPFGSIDETVRGGGSYLIRYQPETATVLDVFYCSTSGSPSKFNHRLLTSEGEAYADVLACKGDSAEKKHARRTYEYGDNSILGWYGGEDAANLPTISLKSPTIEVINDDILYVKVTDAPENAAYNGKYSLKLIVTGETSNAQKSFVLKANSGSSESVEKDTNNGGRLNAGTTYEIILDDITTSNRHFYHLNSGLLPGENITVQAVAYSTNALANIAYSESKTTNSLFADIADIRVASGNAGTDNVFETAYISSIRHLENLGQHISKLGAIPTPTNKIFIKNAEQTTDLNWSTFQQNIRKITKNDDDVSIYYLNKTATDCIPTTPGTFCPVDIPTMYYFNDFLNTSGITLQYDGKQHSISGIEINFDGNGGLFNIITPYSSVSNLRLIDFDITASKEGCSAGALAGAMGINGSAMNVVAYNTPEKSNVFTSSKPNIVSTSGEAGGLIGSMSDGSSLTYCAASLYVNGDSAAGGLVGTCAGTITDCYAGGHTDLGEYYTHDSQGHRTDPIQPIYNVVSNNGGAGGLAGNGGNSIIINSYSTCSVFGKAAGGLIGNMQKNVFTGGSNGGSTEYGFASVRNCYCTGLVSGTETQYAFLASGSLTSDSGGNYYYSVINQIPSTAQGAAEGDTEPMLPYSGYAFASDNAKVKPLDLNAETYNTFTGAWDDWAPAEPYDTILVQYYSGKYPLRAIKELNVNLPAGSFVSTHYGDWPSPEVFFINEK